MKKKEEEEEDFPSQKSKIGGGNFHLIQIDQECEHSPFKFSEIIQNGLVIREKKKYFRKKKRTRDK